MKSNASLANSAGSIQTVRGPVNPADVGRVLFHEHPLSLVPGPWLSGGIVGRQREGIERAVAALAPLGAAGFDAVVDLSPYGVVGRSDDGHNVAALVEISDRTGLHIVAGSAVYLEAFSPVWTTHLDGEGLANRFVADTDPGFDSTHVRAGVFGEQATGLDEITPHEEKGLRAAARAARRSGMAVATHTTHGTMVREQIAILREEDLDLDRVVIGHLDIPTDDTDVRFALECGATIAIDTIGKQHWDFFLEPERGSRADGEYAKRAYFRSDESRADRVAELVADGWVERIVLSMDLTGAETYLNPSTHGQWGYSYLPRVFLPMLRRRGVSEDQLDTMLHSNPVRLLTIGAAR